MNHTCSLVQIMHVHSVNLCTTHTNSVIISNRVFKMSKIDDCKLKNVGELPFNHYYGGCNTFDFGIMLCFSSHTSEARQECHS